MAANGSKIESYGEKEVAGYTDDWHGISMTMQRAGVHKTLASGHRMNQGGNKVVLDGKSSYIEHKATGKKTPIQYEDGQYVFHTWAKRNSKEASKDAAKILSNNKYAALAAVEEDQEQVTDEADRNCKQVFNRRGKSL